MLGVSLAMAAEGDRPIDGGDKSFCPGDNATITGSKRSQPTCSLGGLHGEYSAALELLRELVPLESSLGKEMVRPRRTVRKLDGDDAELDVGAFACECVER